MLTEEEHLLDWVSWLGASYVLLASVLSGLLYKHRGRPYARGKPGAIASITSFKAVSFYLRVSTAVLGVAAFLFNHSALLEVHRSAYLAMGGIAISALGLLAFVWSKTALGTQYSPCFDAMLPTEVVDRGPYRWVRHPIYSANVVLLLGIAIGTGSMWLFFNAVILAAYYIYTAPIEERELAANLHDYSAYILRTGRFVPWIW